MTLVGAGILWLGWNGFNGGDPYFANADAGAAVLNTNTATAVALLVWTLHGQDGLRQAVGPRRGQRHDRRPRGITPGAGYVNGWGAIIIGIVAGIIPWLTMNKLQKTSFMMRVDDTLSVFSTHGVAGLTGGLLAGILANPGMLEYIGTDKEAPGVNVTGLLLRQPRPAPAAGLRRGVHHRLQRDRDLHHPQGHLVHRAAAHGRRDAEGRRRRGSRRDRLRDRSGRRVESVASNDARLAGGAAA